MNKKYQQTPSQTVGPYFAYGLTPEQYLYDFKSIADNYLYKDASEAEERILIKGRLFDGNGAIIPDAMIELRQDDTLDGFGRWGTGTERGNTFTFNTIKPKSKDGQAPHINVVVMMRGLLSHVYTRIYFSDEVAANADDPVLNLIDEDRRHTLIARRNEMGGQIVYQFDIHMQGEHETVFFDA
ncbi:MAG: protocatechuate 3,4-dioxygenase subunit alpha [Saprospiraceae bacterium]|nr:protocatechuate 3,4-dioxygenase subunit alpha [Lewinella sp.]